MPSLSRRRFLTTGAAAVGLGLVVVAVWLIVARSTYT